MPCRFWPTDHRFAHVVAAGAVAPRPAIRADVAAALLSHVRRAEPEDPAWADLAAALVDAFLAHISDLPSEFSPAHRSAAPKSARRKAREAAAFAAAAERAAGLPDGAAGQGAGDGGGRDARPAAAHRGGGRRPATPARGVTRRLAGGGSISDTIRNMSTGVIESVAGPEPGWLDAMMTLLRRAEYLGLLDPGAGHRPDEPWAWLPTVVAGMADRGLPTGGRWQQLDRTADWRRLARTGAGTDTDTGHPAGGPGRLGPALAGAVAQINDQLEMSPQPAGEWAPVTGTLGEDLLAELVGVSVSSVRRYAGGSRVTPQDVAERLHFLALLIADLAGSYNDFGDPPMAEPPAHTPRWPVTGQPAGGVRPRGPGRGRGRVAGRHPGRGRFGREHRVPARRPPVPVPLGNRRAARRSLARRRGGALPVPGRHPGRGVGRVPPPRGDHRPGRPSRHHPQPLGDRRAGPGPGRRAPPRDRHDDAAPDMTGGPGSYPACQDYARAQRGRGVTGLVAPSAALLPGAAGGQVTDNGLRDAENRDGATWVLFGTRPRLRGWRVVDRARPRPRPRPHPAPGLTTGSIGAQRPPRIRGQVPPFRLAPHSSDHANPTTDPAASRHRPHAPVRLPLTPCPPGHRNRSRRWRWVWRCRTSQGSSRGTS